MYAISIRESINRILKTKLGSRVMRPTFGSDLYKLRDREFNNLYKTLATKYINEAININEPRVKVSGLDFKMDENTSKVACFIHLEIDNNHETLEFIDD